MLRMLLVGLALGSAEAAVAAQFDFGSERNGLTGNAAGVVVDAGLELSLRTVVPGSLLSERASGGLGIDSQSIADANDNSGTASRVDFNVLGGPGPLAGVGEAIMFSFDRPGLLTELDFDGVKDESFEYFRLQSDAGLDVFFFDSAADPTAIVVVGDVVFLLEEEGNRFIDDRTPPLSIPFAAGEGFTLTFGELPFGDVANGARLSGLTVIAIPEPSAAALFALLLGGCAIASVRRT